MDWKLTRRALIVGISAAFVAGGRGSVAPEGPNQRLQSGIDITPGGSGTAATRSAEIARVATLLGTLDGRPRPVGNRCKFFDDYKGLTYCASQYEQSGYDGLPILCHKVDNIEAYNARLDALTKPEIWVYMQEWQPHTDVSDMNAVYQHMDRARRVHPNGHFVDLLVIDSGYQNLVNPGMWAGLDHATAHINWVAADYYVHPKDFSTPPSELFSGIVAHKNRAIAENYAEFKGWGLSEYGISSKNVDGSDIAGTRRAKVLHDQWSWLQSEGATWVNYWESDWSSTDGNKSSNVLLEEDPEVVAEYLTWLDRRDLVSGGN